MLLGCAFGAAAVLIAQPQRAQAQGFQGVIDGSSGSVTRTQTGPSSETITIGSPTAIIDWSPDYVSAPPTFDFLPAGHSTTFEGAANFAVLNRIGGPAVIELNGTVIGQLQGSPGTRTGTILFQTPGGFIIGPSAVFNVGSLVLSSLEVATTGEGGPGPYFNPSSLSFSLGGSSPTASIVTAGGSQINAPAEGSYIALVAPRVAHAGTVNVNGSAAYVAAEAVDIFINQGLFDIAVSSGTNDGQGIVHTGTTTGPASTGGGDNHRIYMVAIPKNQSIVALLRGSAGYAPAASANIENGTIVLTSGYNVAGGAPAGRAGGTGAAFWLVQNGSFSSDVTGRASAAFEFSDEVGPISFGQDVSVRGDGFVNFLAETGSTISVAGNLTLSSTNDRSALSDGSAASGGPIAFLAVSGSTISVGGNVLLESRAIGAGGSGAIAGGNATGGDAFVDAAGGQVLVGGTLRIDASATGGSGTIAGNALGGEAGIIASNGGDVSAFAAEILAEGIGGSGPGSDGGDGTGGTLNVIATGAGSTINLASLVGRGISATGYGGANEGGGNGVAGTGTGGSLFISANADGAIALSGSLSNTWARGIGGSPTADGSTGGFAQGGTITFQAVGAGSSLSGSGLNISANGFGRFPNIGSNLFTPLGNNVTGGNAAGGTTTIRAESGGTVFLANGTIARASGIGGIGTGSGNGGSGTGGQLNVDVDGGALIMQVFSAAGISFGASGGGGDGAIGGDGSLGRISLRVANGGLLRANNPNADPSDLALLFFVQGVGGAGDIQGGTGQAGIIEIDIDPLSTGSTIDVGVGAARFAANGIGGGVRAGSAGVGGAGIGGQIDLVTGVSNDAWTFNSLVVDVTGTGGRSISSTPGASGGAGTGGSARVGTPTGQLTASLALTVNATGTGGAGFGSGTGGPGTGGLAEIVNSGGTLTAGSTQLLSGGDGGSGSTGGNGIGGTTRITSTGGQSTFGAAEIDSEAVGGAGTVGAGGTGTAGSATLLVSAGTVQFAELEVDANADGGDGATSGGGAIAGPARVDVTGGTLGVTTTLTIEADAEGGAGSGGSGGLADGGNSVLAVNGGSVTAGGFEATARGLGGAATTAGGTGLGGEAFLISRSGEVVVGVATITATGTGGLSFGGTGGQGTGGLAQLVAEDGGNLSLTTAVVTANGLGGAGSTGGTGTGGTNTAPANALVNGGAFVFASDGGRVTGANVTLTSTGTGGDGDLGGVGGAGNGGWAYVIALNGTASSLVDIDSVTIAADAFGGWGSTPVTGGGAAGGNATGGLIGAYAESLNGELRIDNLLASADALGGRGGFGANGGAGGRGGNALGGISTGIGTVSGPGSGAPTGRTIFGTIEVSASATGGAGGTGGGGATPGAGGDGGAAIGGGRAGLLARGGTLMVTTAEFHADAIGGAGGAAGGSGAAVGRGGNATGGSAGALLTVRNQTTDPATVTVGSFVASSIAQGGAGSTTGQTFFGTTNIEIDRSSATFGSADLAVQGSGAAPSVAPTTVRVTGGTLSVTSSAGLEIDTPGNVLFDLIGSGIVTVKNLDSNAGGTTTIQHSGRIGNANSIGAGTMSFTAGGDFTAAAGTQLGAQTSISVNTNANALFAGGALAPTISIRSADIEIAGTGVIGDEDNPGVVTLTVAPNGQQTVVGGATEGPGYTLTQAEAERIEAETVTLSVSKVSATANRAPDVVVGNLLIAGSQADGPSSVTLQTDGIARIAGAVEYRGAAAGDRLTIDATERLEVITPGGSITVVDSGGDLSGQLVLTSTNVVVASAGLAAQLAADPALPSRAEALRTNDGPVNEGGYIQAGTIRFGSVGKVFVQNTGTDTAFGGLTVGSSSGTPTLVFDLVGSGAPNPSPEVIAFGRRQNADGTFTSGESFFDDVDFRTAQGVVYAEASQFNGCSINTGCIPPLRSQVTNQGVLLGPLDSSSVPDAADDGEGESAQQFGSSFVGLVDTSSLSAEELIDEAVTSGGDSTLWQDECDPEDPLCEAREDRPIP